MGLNNLISLIFKADTKELKDAKKELQGIKDAASDAIPGFDRLSSSIANLKSPMTALVFTAGTLSVALVTLVGNVAKFQDELGDLSQYTGIAVEDLSIMEQVARQSGASWDTISNSIDKFSKSMGKAQNPTSEQARVLKELGVGPGSSLDEVAKALDRYEAGAGKAYATSVLFGRQGKEINEWLTDYARRGEMSAEVTKKNADEADKLRRSWFSLTSTMTTWGTAAANPVISYLNTLIDRLRYVREELAKNPWWKAPLSIVQGLNNAADMQRYGEESEKFRAANDWGRPGKDQLLLSEGGGGGKPWSLRKGSGLDDIVSALKDAERESDAFWKDWNRNFDFWRKQQADGYAELEKNDREYQDRLKRQLEMFAEYGDKSAALKQKIADLKNVKQEFVDTYGMEKFDEQINRLYADLSKLEHPIKSSTDSMQAMFDQLTRAVEGYTQNMADAFVEFASGSKSSFSDMVASMLKDLAKLLANQAFKSILGGWSGSSTGGLLGDIVVGIMGAADGGPVAKGRTTLVGERGPELFVPKTSGYVVPNHALGSGGSTVVNNVTVNVKGGNTNEETGATVSKAVVDAMRSVARDEIALARRPGQLLNPMRV